jgi:two-component system NtrC family sensor kinase
VEERRKSLPAAMAVAVRGPGPMPPVILADAFDAWRTVTRDLLETEGVDVDEAADADHALRLVSLRAPQLVVIDAMLPGMNPSALARRIRAEHPGTLVACVTTVPRSWLGRLCDLSVFDAIIPKLSEPDALLNQLLAMLGPSATRRARRLTRAA